MESQELLSDVVSALDQPPGSKAEVLGPLLTAYFSHQFASEVEGGGRRYRLFDPADADALFRHVAGGRWTQELLRQKQVAMASDALLSLGFRDAPFSELAEFTQLNEFPLARILDARAGLDSPEVLLDFAKRSATRRRKSATLAAAIVVMKAVPEGLEAELELELAGWDPLLRKALRALGPARASEVALRQLRQADDEPDSTDKRTFVWQALAPVQSCFGPFFTPAAEQAIAERIEALDDRLSGYWESAGERLASTGEWDTVMRFAQARVAHHPGWRRALRSIVDVRVRGGWALPAELDELIDPGAAKEDYDVRKGVLRLLKAIPVDRAEKLLAEAKYDAPRDALDFLIPGLSEAMLLRLAELHVSLRDDEDSRHHVIATDLRPLGPAFGAALQTALASVKPRVGYLKSLKSNLDAPVFDALSKWIEERPEPKRPKKPKKV